MHVGGRTVCVLRDVKLSQDDNRVFSQVPASSFVRRVHGVLEAVESINFVIISNLILVRPPSPFVHSQHASTPTKLDVFAPVEYLMNA